MTETSTPTVLLTADAWHAAHGIIDGELGYGRAVYFMGGWSADWATPDSLDSVVVGVQHRGDTPADAIAAAWEATR